MESGSKEKRKSASVFGHFHHDRYDVVALQWTFSLHLRSEEERVVGKEGGEGDKEEEIQRKTVTMKMTKNDDDENDDGDDDGEER